MQPSLHSPSSFAGQPGAGWSCLHENVRLALDGGEDGPCLRLIAAWCASGLAPGRWFGAGNTITSKVRGSALVGGVGLEQVALVCCLQGHGRLQLPPPPRGLAR